LEKAPIFGRRHTNVRAQPAPVELHADVVPAEIMPPHRCNNTFGGGFIGGHIGI